jgi:hypothetical protein
MQKIARRALVASGVALLCFTAQAWAQEPMRVRGTVEAMDGAMYVVKTRSGDTVKVALTDKPLFVAMAKVSMADIKPGMFVGTTALPQADGSLRAVEVHIFPEAMRGTGEGHRPWDLQPQSTMTNATVDQMVTAVGDHSLTLKYKEGEKKIVVGPDCPIVTYAPADKAELKPGAKIFINAATKEADGTLSVPRINVGRDAAPPM